MRCILGVAVALVCCAADEELSSCSTDQPEPSEGSAEGKKINLLQTKSQSVLNLASYSEVVASVNITLHNALGVERRPEDKHRWVVTLPKTCSDADVHAFATGMPHGAKPLFLGTPSNTGLPCALVMEATEAQLHEQVKAHPGAESAQVDLHWEEHRALLAEVPAATGAAGNPAGLPEGEGLPDVPSSLLPEDRRRVASLAEANAEQRSIWGMGQEEFSIPGPWNSNNGGPYTAFVFYPTEIHDWANVSKHPVVSVGHGYTQFGDKVKEQLVEGFIRPMVEWGGYVVVAHGTCKGWCDTSSDMLYVLDWITKPDSPFVAIIDPSKAAVVGYSMGGRFALEVAHSDADIQKYHISAVAALMPPCKQGCPTSHVPVFLGAGSADTTCPDDFIERTYDQVVGTDKAFCNVAGAPHWEVGVWGQNRHETHLLQFLGCYLWNTRSLCDKIFSECLSDRATER